jgi:hypothetical protein
LPAKLAGMSDIDIKAVIANRRKRLRIMMLL